MEDFEKIIEKDIVIVAINLVRSTYKEAGELKKILEDDIEKGYQKVIIDLSECDFIDSTFLGVLVFGLKKIASIGGEIKIVKSDSILKTLMARLGTLDIFNVYDTIEEAFNSYEYNEISNHYIGKSYNYQVGQ
jgi:anti-anti-sigma factor